MSSAELAEQTKRGKDGDKDAAFAVHRHFEFTTDNKEQADRWLRISADLKHPSAMFNLGYQLVHTPGSEREGLALIKSSAKHGNVTAIRYLGNSEVIGEDGEVESNGRNIEADN